jgi:hypothetical protein
VSSPGRLEGVPSLTLSREGQCVLVLVQGLQVPDRLAPNDAADADAPARVRRPHLVPHHVHHCACRRAPLLCVSLAVCVCLTDSAQAMPSQASPCLAQTLAASARSSKSIRLPALGAVLWLHRSSACTSQYQSCAVVERGRLINLLRLVRTSSVLSGAKSHSVSVVLYRLSPESNNCAPQVLCLHAR